MKHKSIQDDLIFYLDGDLSPEREVEIRQHLSQCASCGELLEVLSEVSRVIEHEKHRPVNPYFYSSLIAKMENSHHGELNHSWIRILQPAFFTVLLFIGIGVGVFVGAQIESAQQAGLSSEEMFFFDEMGTEPIESYFLK